ncbi:fungal-specific transcription factor domain-containing protein [Durotheca rogersii]|uniref:fungal-specific transcription factor domain-containing protein n=1 Tax=Durotheca rogersii TaxID=419775 RepID=UPI0022200941|nr:fungal-specific transcription factor domain-containing protein [Durotheca rogersii]KAI5859444.1 fungal-specific transcription factor domain-containing protein [Durotheca rogersii]
MEQRQKRHCWECRRRCLVCDFALPGYKRCSSSGVECPGYGNVKPTRFKWLAPGRVNSRSRRQKGASLGNVGEDDGGRRIGAATPQAFAMINTRLRVPRFVTKTRSCVLIQAAGYFNSCIYRDLIPLHELGQNPHIYPITAKLMQAATICPDYLAYGMVCMTLSHRINQTRSDPNVKVLTERFFSYWGLALRSLNEHLGSEDTRTGDMVIAGMLTLLFVDIQQGVSLSWRCHLDGLHKLIMLRGGLCALAESKSLEPLLLCFWFVAVIGNTTCPAPDLSMTGWQLDMVEFVLEKPETVVSLLLICPSPLFVEIIRINHLRARATRCDTATVAKQLTQEAYEILGRVCGFSPDRWADSKLISRKEWLLIGNVYQATIALYCLLSLQSLSVLPNTPTARALCATHGQAFHELLHTGLSSLKMRRFLIWPLTVLGVEAIHSGAAVQAFIAKQLSGMSHDVGVHAPLAARRVLELFWGSGETCWDACFDRLYSFTTQIAVDTSRLYSTAA